MKKTFGKIHKLLIFKANVFFKIKIRFEIFIIFLTLYFLQCNFTTQSYNVGSTLLPSKSSVSIGVGARRFHRIEEGSNSSANPETTLVYGASAALSGRIGILERTFFGKSLDAGFLIEFPGQFGSFSGLAILEFSIRNGLPQIPLKGFSHSVELGWTVGSWVDNGWFLEYAAGKESKIGIVYSSIRFLQTPTEVISSNFDLMDKNLLVPESASWNIRLAIGDCIRLPVIPFIPRCVIPEIVIVFPHYSKLSSFGITGHIGLIWEFGK